MPSRPGRRTFGGSSGGESGQRETGCVSAMQRSVARLRKELAAIEDRTAEARREIGAR
jgi:hypothetical protein